MSARPGNPLLRISRGIAVGLIRGYQYTISPWLGPSCRFQPTCSEYTIRSIRKHGVLLGCWRGLRRISRCHPWGGSGYDPPQ
ncbi:membrane protein insertion efficiency factor YidD [Adhaeretor mobilis]|uniref:membrane protein insertion efficiency factor YidD n=1 Tax=Adhaeretor mobilis TaxID=1930276 RepID=UPI00119F05D7|nr:membrane protein insertion efficiency factor YidD [Adhaeretor mobilis]